MRGRTRPASVPLLVLGVALVATAVSADAVSGPALSNKGHALRLSPAEQAAMRRRHRSPHVYVMATRAGVTFFRFGDSGRCFGGRQGFERRQVTPATVPAVFGDVVCWNRTSFMAADFSIFGQSRGEAMHLIRLRGIATDRVKRVQLVGADGSVRATVPVVENVYALKTAVPGVVQIRFVGASGAVVTAVP